MQDEVLLSFVFDIYNKADYIREGLDTALAQSCSKEIICVDDCSTDGTREILKEYAARYPEIRLILHEKNECGHISFYDGLAQCRGKYMTIVNGDDALIPYTFDKLCARADEADADVLEFWVKVTPNGDCSAERAKREEAAWSPEERLLVDQDYWHLMVTTGEITDSYVGKLYHRRLYQKVFAEMERIPMGELYPRTWHSEWFFFFFARRWCTAAIQGYHYFPGRGVSHRQSADLSDIQHNCGTAQIYQSMLRAAKKHHASPEQLNDLKQFLYMCRKQSIITWAERIAPQDRLKGWKILTKEWTIEDIIQMLDWLYGECPEKIADSLAVIPWEENGKKGAACVIYDGTDSARIEQTIEWARRVGDTIVIIADDGVRLPEMKRNTDEGPEYLPVGRAYDRQRSWMLRLLLKDVGTVILSSDRKGLSDGLIARSMGCRVLSVPEDA